MPAYFLFGLFIKGKAENSTKPTPSTTSTEETALFFHLTRK